MKRFVLALMCMLLLPLPVLAEYVYVTDSLSATFRTGPGNDHKIIKMVRSGEKLLVLEKQEAWTRVQLTASGTEGWMLNQWLTEDVPKGIQLEALQKKYEALLAKHSSLKQDCNVLVEENKSLKSDLTICNQKENSLRKDYDELKSGSAQFLELKDAYAKTKSNLDAKIQECDTLNDQLTQKWILLLLTGAGILLLGIIMGFSSKQKRRSSLLS